MSFTIRPAAAADAPDILRVRRQGWQETYAHLLSERILADLAADAEARAARLAARLAGNQEAGLVEHWVAAGPDGGIIGFAAAGPTRPDPDPTPSAPLPPEELYALYLLRGAHGGGAGQALLDAALGARPAALWVLEDNPRARAFYLRNGFRPDGAALELGDEWQGAREIRMVRR